MLTFFTILITIWIVGCAAIEMFLVYLIVSYGRKFKKEGWGLAAFLSVLLLVGMSWGYDRLVEISDARERTTVITEN